MRDPMPKGARRTRCFHSPRCRHRLVYEHDDAFALTYDTQHGTKEKAVAGTAAREGTRNPSTDHLGTAFLLNFALARGGHDTPARVLAVFAMTVLITGVDVCNRESARRVLVVLSFDFRLVDASGDIVALLRRTPSRRARHLRQFGLRKIVTAPPNFLRLAGQHGSAC